MHEGRQQRRAAVMPNVRLAPMRARARGLERATFDVIRGRASQAAPSIVRIHRPTLVVGVLVLTLGLAVHMGALALIERLVPSFPAIPDVLQARIPYIAFGVPGELCFLAFLVALAVVVLKSRPRDVPSVLTMIGLFYAARSLFLFFLPIGMPPTAPPIASRLSLYPFAGHAYFPGGHTGVMTILSLSVHVTRWRRVFLAATALFAFGTMLARTHYTADALGGWLLGYAIINWGRRHLGSRP
jgi:hypothetical protein